MKQIFVNRIMRNGTKRDSNGNPISMKKPQETTESILIEGSATAKRKQTWIDETKRYFGRFIHDLDYVLEKELRQKLYLYPEDDPRGG